MNAGLATVSVLAVLLAPNPAESHDQIFQGTYIWGAEVNSFSPCGTDESFWASYDWAGFKLVEFYKAHATEPYQSIYVKFRGHFLDEEVNGFAADYDGLVRISEIIEMSDVVPGICE